MRYISKDIYNSSNNVFHVRNAWKLAYLMIHGYFVWFPHKASSVVLPVNGIQLPQQWLSICNLIHTNVWMSYMHSIILQEENVLKLSIQQGQLTPSSLHIITICVCMYWEHLRPTLLVTLKCIKYSIVNYSHHAVH